MCSYAPINELDVALPVYEKMLEWAQEELDIYSYVAALA